MKIFIKWFLIIYIFMSICGAGNVFAEDFCEDVIKRIQQIASFFNSQAKGNIGEGEFEVNHTQISEGSNPYSIKYKITNRKAYQYEYNFQTPKTRYIISLELSAHKFGGLSGLLFNYRMFGDVNYSCPYIIIPQNGKFSSLKINKNALFVMDLDQDNDTELVDWEPEEWSADCQVIEIVAETHDGIISWPKIFHLDPKNGQLVDVSQLFPQFYSNQLNEGYPSEFQQKVKNSNETLPA